MHDSKIKVAIVGPGNIGTDLMMKILKLSTKLELVALVGIDPASDGLKRAADLGIRTVSSGVQGLIDMPGFEDIRIIFDATSASAHRENAALLDKANVILIDLTPAALGPFVVPPVNLEAHRGSRNVNMVTCGGQATIPVVAAIAAVTPVHYGEIVASIASRSAGPGTRANIDEFTQTTAKAVEEVGGATIGKAIIILNPATPPLIMRDTVLCIVDRCDQAAVAESVEKMVARVNEYVPGYRLKQEVHFREIGPDDFEADLTPKLERRERLVVSVFLEVEGAGHYLPPYAGNLDIMTSAALRTGEDMVKIGAIS